MAQRRNFTDRFRDDDHQRSDESYRSSAYDDRDQDWRYRADAEDRARRDRHREDRDFHSDTESRRPWQSPNFSDSQARGPGYGPSHVASPNSPQPAYPSTFIENHTGLGYGQGQSLFGGGAASSGFTQDSTQVPFYAHAHPPHGINPTAGWPTQYSSSPSPYGGSGFAQQAQGYGSAPARYQGQSQQQAGSYGAQEPQFGQNTSGAQSHAHDYGRWRHEQLNKLDTQYQTWRDHQARQYDDEFARFSQHRHAEFSKRFEDWRTQNDRASRDTSDTGTHGAASGLGSSSGTQNWQNIGSGFTNATGTEADTSGKALSEKPADPAAKTDKPQTGPSKH